MRTISRENEVKMLNITQLKMHAQAEWNSFKKHLQKEANYHCIEANGNRFYQIIHDGAALLNKHKHQAFGMQFVDMRFRYDNDVALSFRK